MKVAARLISQRRCLFAHSRQASSGSACSVQRWLSQFEKGLAAGCTRECFSSTRCFWRDMVSFTWNISTFEGTEHVARALAETASVAAPHSWRVDGTPSVGPDGETEAWLTFKTATGLGKAHVRLDEENRATTLATSLTALEDRPFATRHRRPLGHPCASVHEIAQPRPGRRYWHQRRAAESPRALGGEADDPYVLIIGGGQVSSAVP